MGEAISREDIKKILEAAVWAPSGDNSQPWEFYVKGNRIIIVNIPSRDNPILNYRQRGSYVANGAVIENIIIAARHYGLNPSVRLFPEIGIPDAVAEVIFTTHSISSAHGDLYECIRLRRTNRKPYSMRPLLKNQIEKLMRSVRDTLPSMQEAYEVRIIDDLRVRQILAEAASSIEQVILENRELHKLLFRDVVWSSSAERRRRRGLYMATMEFSPPQRIAFWLASHWSLMRVFAALGLPRKIAEGDAELYATGAAIGMVIAKDKETSDYVNGGRIMQRVWLVATQMGLSVQPLTALLFAAGRIVESDTWTLSRRHVDAIRTHYDSIIACMGLRNEVIPMMFRIGFADPPSAGSSRIDPIVHDMN